MEKEIKKRDLDDFLDELEEEYEERVDDCLLMLDRIGILSAIMYFKKLLFHTDRVISGHINNYVELHSRQAFDELVVSLPNDSYIHGKNNGGKILSDRDINYDYDEYYFMVDKRTAMCLTLCEITDSYDNSKKYELNIDVQRGNNKLTLNYEDVSYLPIDMIYIKDDYTTLFEVKVDTEKASTLVGDASAILGIVNLHNNLITPIKQDMGIQRSRR